MLSNRVWPSALSSYVILTICMSKAEQLQGSSARLQLIVEDKSHRTNQSLLHIKSGLVPTDGPSVYTEMISCDHLYTAPEDPSLTCLRTKPLP